MKNIIIAVFISFMTAFLTANYFSPQNKTISTESAYERVMRTKTLRCGWFVEPPFINFDNNSGERNGIVIDIIEKFAKEYDLKVTWETISNFALMGEDLKQGKYDAICSSLINMPRGGLIDSVDAFAFVPTYAYVRSDETRFSSLAELNDPAYIIAGQEGAAVTTVAREKFPKAQFDIIPSAELSEMLANVVAKKADVTFMIPTFFEQFLKNNPGTLKPLDPSTPLQVFSFAFGVKPEEDGLKSLLNNSLQRMMISGELAAIYAKHDPEGLLMYPLLSNSAVK